MIGGLLPPVCAEPCSDVMLNDREGNRPLVQAEHRKGYIMRIAAATSKQLLRIASQQDRRKRALSVSGIADKGEMQRIIFGRHIAKAFIIHPQPCPRLQLEPSKLQLIRCTGELTIQHDFRIMRGNVASCSRSLLEADLNRCFSSCCFIRQLVIPLQPVQPPSMLDHSPGNFQDVSAYQHIGPGQYAIRIPAVIDIQHLPRIITQIVEHFGLKNAPLTEARIPVNEQSPSPPLLLHVQ
ncbi:hypothetical protein D3C78_1129120 [compost metagenome]